MTDLNLDIPDFLKRSVEPHKPRRATLAKLTMPKYRKLAKASKAQIKALVSLGYSLGFARSKRRDDAASLIRFNIKPEYSA